MAAGKLFMSEMSPPCRAVLLTAKALDIKLDIIRINLFKGEHLTEEFLKLNPAHSIPTYLDQDGTAMGDSHAIMAFLVGKYGRSDCLYPRDLNKRALIDQRLHFDSGNVYALHVAIVRPMWMREASGPNEKQLAAAEITYEILNAFLEGTTNWVAGCTPNPTIADFSLVTSITAFSIVAPFDSSKFPNILPWIHRCEALPYYQEVNKKGMVLYNGILRDMLRNKYDFC